MPRPYHNTKQPHGEGAPAPGRGRQKQAERVFHLLDENGAPATDAQGVPVAVTGLAKLDGGMVRVHEVADPSRVHEVRRDRLLADEGAARPAGEEEEE